MLSAFPPDLIFDCFLNEPYAFEDISYIVDASFLDVELLCRIVQVYTLMMRVLDHGNKLACEFAQTIFMS